jgi:lactoylglutathione lyase
MTSAAGTESASSDESILEWEKADNRRFLHVVYRVGDLEKTIK